MTTSLYVIVAPGLEAVVASELEALGFSDIEPGRGGVSCSGDAARANLHLRAATRVIERVAQFKATRFADLTRKVARVDWSPYGGLTPQATCRKSRLYHTGAVEEAVAKAVPPGDGTLMVRIERDVCTLSVDTSGERLHRRGWRLETGHAPLRETLAAGLLSLADWSPSIPLYDPMCGSGTFLIEAATWAAGLPAGRLRSFANSAAAVGGEAPPCPEERHGWIAGSDRSGPAIQAARRNAERAGVEGWLTMGNGEVGRITPPEGVPPGLLICNPPYGRRVDAARHTMGRLKLALEGPFAPWRAAIFAPQKLMADGQAKAMWGRSISARHSIDNGGLKTVLLVLNQRTDPA
ncbi:MAG: class I SAM-dependent RNA methyltransferase [Bradymonadia bacterium]